MAEATNDLLLSVLRQVQADTSEIKRDVAGLRTDMSKVNQKVDGLTVVLALLAGHVRHVEQRVQVLEQAGS